MVQTIVQSLGSSASSGDDESSGFTSEQTVQEVATVLDGVMGLFGEQGLDFFHGPVLSEAASVLARYHLPATYLTTATDGWWPHSLVHAWHGCGFRAAMEGRAPGEQPIVVQTRHLNMTALVDLAYSFR